MIATCKGGDNTSFCCDKDFCKSPI